MWKLWHKLFGWDYVMAYFGWSPYIRRVHIAPNGIRYIKWYGSMYLEGERHWRALT